MESEQYKIPGIVTVKPEVLETIASLTSAQVPGVVRIAEKDLDRFLGIASKGVEVEVREGRVTVNLHLIAEPNLSLLRLGQTVQHEVTRAIQEMIGMPVEAVNIYIEDVMFPEAAPAPAQA